MLHGSETWPVRNNNNNNNNPICKAPECQKTSVALRKENKVAFQQAEKRIVRWMCDVKVKDKVPSKELRERTMNR